MYQTHVRRVGPLAKSIVQQAIIPPKSSMLVGIAIAPQSLVDSVVLMPNGEASGPNAPIVVGVGAPWVGALDCSSLALAGAPTMVDAGHEIVQLHRYGLPGVIATGTVWNGRNVGGLIELSADLLLYYNCPPPVMPMRRAQFAGVLTASSTGTYYFPVYGRTKISVSLERVAGTSIDYAIRGIDRTNSGVFCGATDAAIASGTLTDGFQWGYDGPPYEWIQVDLSNPVAAGTAEIFVQALDP